MSNRRIRKKKSSDLSSPVSKWKSKFDTNYAENVADQDSNFDNESVHSFTSLSNEVIDCDDLNLHFSSEELSKDNLEAKLIQYLENTNEKSAKIRTDALKKIKIILSNKSFNDFVTNRRDTISEAIKRCLKKGKEDEREHAILLASIIFIILGCNSDCDVFFNDLKPILVSYLNDKSVNTKSREYCALALSIGCFISPTGVDYIEKIIDNLYNIFSDSFPNTQKIYPTLTPQILSLHNASLNGWSLLLTILSSSNVRAMAETTLTKIASLLNSNDQELRLSAGEAISLLHEISREIDSDFKSEDIIKLTAQMKELATYSLKFRSKKDRKVERSNFRDIIRSVQDYESPSFIIKRRGEIIELNSWAKKIQYDIFCRVLGSGMLYHLGENQFIRDVLDLGSLNLINQTITERKIKKYENNEADKIRSKAMRELKGKRYDYY